MDSFSLPETGFSAHLLRHNGLQGFVEWAFYPGMLFGSRLKWWGRGYRDRPHEGLDMCLYRDREGRLRSLSENTRIPVIYEGEVANVVKDFLGQSVFVRHDLRDRDGFLLHTVYGHTAPLTGVSRGSAFAEGDIMATLAAAGDRRIPPHLHVSMAWISPSLLPEELNWGAMGDPHLLRFLDPLPVLTDSYTVLERA
jgi:hypothetical protein